MQLTQLPAFLPPNFDVSIKNLVFKRTSEQGDHSNKKIGSSEKLSRKGHKKTCSKCGVIGHTEDNL